MQISNARATDVPGRYDVTVIPDDGDPFDYTVAPDDPAPLAEAIRKTVRSRRSRSVRMLLHRPRKSIPMPLRRWRSVWQS